MAKYLPHLLFSLLFFVVAALYLAPIRMKARYYNVCVEYNRDKTLATQTPWTVDEATEKAVRKCND